MSTKNFFNGYGFNRQRSLYQRRETSPMSLRSFPDFEQHNSRFVRGTTCERSVISGRSQSGSIGTVDSTTSAVCIAQTLKNTKFNNYEKKIIHEAYNKYIRNRKRRRIGKRLKLKSFLNRNRRKSDDSGDEGSISSTSSDDNMSVRSEIPKESILRPRNRSNRTEILNFRTTMKECDMYKDCTENFKHSTLKSMFNDYHHINQSSVEKKNVAIERQMHPRRDGVISTQIKRFDKGFMLPSDRFNKTVVNPVTNNYLSHNIEARLLSNTANVDSMDSESEDIFPNQTLCENTTRSDGVIGTQINRFNKGFMLPYNRFNKTIVNPVTNNYLSHNIEAQLLSNTANVDNMDSENEDIFPNQTLCENTTICRKRTLENHETIFSDEKRNKLSSFNPNDDPTFKKPLMPIRKQVKAKPNFLSDQIISKYTHPLMKNMGPTSLLPQSLNHEQLNISHYNNKNVNSFLNTKNNSKPVNTASAIDKMGKNISNKDNSGNDNLKNALSQQIRNEIEKRDKNDNNTPMKTITSKTSSVKKNNSKKNLKESSKEKETEKLISKSAQPLVGNIEIINHVHSDISQPQSSQVNKTTDVNTSEMPLSISNVSMKPSFIKRKLFTQKLDVVEDKNSSVDSTSTNSPQNRNYRFREKNKVRKLATSQSCLSRDVIGEENILDLIHKIVPADQINLTSASNQRRKSNLDNEDRWDVASVISMCNTVESETFTDEDIFQVTNAKNKNQKKNHSKKNIEKQKCKIVEKLPQENIKDLQSKPNVSKANCATKRTVASAMWSFWDTDFETDNEENRSPFKTHANNLAPINEKQPVQYRGNVLKPKDNAISSKCVSQELVEKSLSNCEITKASANIVTNDNNIQKDSKICSTQRTMNNSTTKNGIKSLGKKEVKNVLSENKLSNNMQKRGVRTQNSMKSVETKLEVKAKTKSNTKEEEEISNIKLGNKIPDNNANLLNECEFKSQSINNTKSTQKNKKDGEDKLINRLKEVRIYLNDSLNSSTSEHSILTRSLTRKIKQQLINEMNKNEKLSTPKTKPKSIKRSTPKRTPLTNKVRSIKKQITITTSKPTKTTPPRRAKDKKNEFSKLNESLIITRNRSFNGSLRVRTPKRNIKCT